MAIILNEERVKKINFENNVSRMIKVYNNHDMKAMFKEGANSEVRKIENRQIRRIMKASSPNWVNSAEYNLHWSKIEDKAKLIKKKFPDVNDFKRNISHYPAGAEDFFDLIRMDITMRIMERADYVPFLCTVIQRDDFTNPMYVQWLLDYVAPFKEFKGQGDPVNLVQIKTGQKDSIDFTLWGVGFEQDLYNQLFNDIFDMQKVNDAVARGYIRRKTDNVFAPIFAFAYPANKIVTATTIYSLDQNYYDTLQDAITTLGLLLDFQTSQEIDIFAGLALICHSTRVRGINRAINGNLLNGDQVKNLQPVSEITTIIPYNTITEKYGAETITYQGCGRDVAYLFIPKKTYWYLLKRDLTHKTGPGDTFAFTSDKDAWYFVDSNYSDQFFGGDTSDPATSDTAISQADGYIVEINLPDDTEAET